MTAPLVFHFSGNPIFVTTDYEHDGDLSRIDDIPVEGTLWEREAVRAERAERRAAFSRYLAQQIAYAEVML